jgi:hypothetical protein
MESGSLTFVIALVIGILIFILVRSFWLWYFKIAEHIDLMREQNEILKAIFKQLGGSVENRG